MGLTDFPRPDGEDERAFYETNLTEIGCAFLWGVACAVAAFAILALVATLR